MNLLRRTKKNDFANIKITFPTTLKDADVKTVFKKDEKADKENYRPISILPILSKVCEKPIYNLMYPYFDKPFSNFRCSFRKRFNAQHCLITMIEKRRKSVDRGGQEVLFQLIFLKLLIVLTMNY